MLLDNRESYKDVHLTSGVSSDYTVNLRCTHTSSATNPSGMTSSVSNPSGSTLVQLRGV